MAERTNVLTKKDVILTIQDSGAALTYTPTSTVGDFSYDAPQYDLVDILDNGVLDGVRRGDDTPCTFSFSINLTDPGDSGEITLPDICEERGYWNSNATSTTNQQSDVPTVDLVLTIDGTKFGLADKSMTFADCVLRGSGSFEYPAQYSVSGRTVNSIKPTVA